MRRTLSFLLSLVMVIGIITSVPITVSAASVDDLTFTLNSDGKSYSVSDCDTSASGEIIIPSTYNGLSVTNIDWYAFDRCKYLTSITIPDSVTSIGERTFCYCTSLTSITIPDGVTSIGENAFYDCRSLASITIPDSVTSIGGNAFVYCYNLTAIIIPDSVTSIGSSAFSCCTSLASITIPDSVTSIGDGAFWNCYNLTSVTFGNSVKSIGEETFSNCSKLTDVTIPDSVTSIGDNAFYDCDSLTSIIIPDSVTSIGEGAFYNCVSLENVFYEGTQEDWCALNFDYENFCLTNVRIHYNVDIASWENHYGESIVKSPTCTADGSIVYTCPCGYEIIEQIPLLGHSFPLEWTVEKEPTCTKDGLKSKTCSACGDKLTEMLSAFGHTGDWNIEKVPACTESGSRYLCCSNCNEKIVEAIPATGHNYIDGICTVCGCEQPPESSHPYGNNCDEIWSIYREGAKNISITFSEDTETEEGKDYIYIYDGDDNQVGKYSGTELTARTIIVAGDTTKIRIVSDALGQSYGFKIINIECNVICKHDWVTDYENYISATCTEVGKETLKCIICNQVKTTEIPATGHSFGDWVIAKEATCTTNGSEIRTCTTCETVENKDIEAFGHNYSIEWYVDKAATCTEEGTKSHHCSECDSKIDITIISALGHNFVDGTCSFCDNTVDMEYLTFILNDDCESYSVTGYDEFSGGDNIVIPRKYNDLPVTIISSNSFKYSNITHITIPDSVTYIGSNAFWGCERLTSITIPDSVTTVGNTAFYGCENLISVIIGDSVTNIGDEAFWNCYNLTSVTFGNSVKSIGEGTFRYCSKLTDVTIPDSVTNIGNNAFYDCDSLTSIIIPDSVITIGNEAFYGCENLTSAIIGNGVTNMGDFVFKACGSLASVVIGNSVTSIGYSAFSFCENLTSIIIPDSVTSIGDSAFQSCKNLVSVKIGRGLINIGTCAFESCYLLASISLPGGLMSVGPWAFDDCHSLKEVDYKGTSSQWKKIDILTGNGSLINAYYSGLTPPTTPKLTSVSRTASGVKVTWGAVEDADEYIVYRKTSKSGWTNLGTTTSASFTDTKAKTGTTYYYTVKAQNEAGSSGYNKTGLKIKYVAAPKLTKIANESSGVRVYWSKVSGADGYYLYRRVAGTKSWTKIATIKKGTTTSYKDTKASAGKTYEYIIKAYDGSTPSASAAKVIKIKRLAQPSLKTVSSSKTGITVKWGKVAGAEGYYVYRKTGSGSWVKIATVKGNTKVSFVDKTAKKGTTYTYTVKAYSGNYTSSYNTKGLKIKDKY